jgi:hypothetical protein
VRHRWALRVAGLVVAAVGLAACGVGSVAIEPQPAMSGVVALTASGCEPADAAGPDPVAVWIYPISHGRVAKAATASGGSPLGGLTERIRLPVGSYLVTTSAGLRAHLQVHRGAVERVGLNENCSFEYRNER